MRRVLVLMTLIAVTAILPATGSAAGATGVVVGHSGGVLLVAGPRGVVHAVTGRARVGARVTTVAHSLRVVGLARRTHIRGVLVRRNGNSLFLEAAGHMLAVRAGRMLASATASAPSPRPGDVLDAQVSIDTQGTLAEQEVSAVGHEEGARVQATVAAVGDGSVTLSINGRQLTLPLPAGLTLPSAIVGTEVELELSFANGEPTAESAGDDQQADDAESDDAGSADDDDAGAEASPGGDDAASSGSADSGAHHGD